MIQKLSESYCNAPSSRFISRNLACFLEYVGQEVGIGMVQNPGKCLGLPNSRRSSKNEALAAVMNRILKKLVGWKAKLMSEAHREVRIKFVAYAIPPRSMACFKLPENWFEVDAAIARF